MRTGGVTTDRLQGGGATAGGRHLGTALAVHRCRDDASGVACSLAAGEEAAERDVLEGVALAQYAQGGGGAGFDGQHGGLVGEEAAVATSEGAEGLLEARGDEAGEPEVQRAGQEAGGIAALVEFGAEATVHKVGHALGGGCLAAHGLEPAVALELFLEQEGAEDVVVRVVGRGGIRGGGREGIRSGGVRSLAALQGYDVGTLQFGGREHGGGHDVLGAHLHHHAGVAPASSAVGGAHAVDHHLLGAAGGRHHHAAGAHAEAVHSAAGHLPHHGVLGGREPAASALGGVVLYPVYEVGGVFQADAYGQSLGLHLYVGGVEVAVDVAGGVPRSQDDAGGKELAVAAAYAAHLIALYDEGGHARLEVHFATAGEDGAAHVLYDARQAVGAHVGMCVHQYVGVGAVLHEDAEHLLAVAALLAARVELTVAVGPCPTLAEGVVALGVHALLGAYAGQVLLAFAHVLAAFHHYGAQPQLYQTEGGKEASRACSHDDDGATLAHVGVMDGREELPPGLLAHEGAHCEVDVNCPLPGVYAAAEHLHGIGLEAALAPEIGDDAALIVGIARAYA